MFQTFEYTELPNEFRDKAIRLLLELKGNHPSNEIAFNHLKDAAELGHLKNVIHFIIRVTPSESNLYLHFCELKGEN